MAIRKIVLALLSAMLLCTPAMAVSPLEGADITIGVPSAVLMEKVSGEIIYTKNPHDKLYPASVTKVMTLLLVVEEIERGHLKMDDLVCGSSRACSMGGSQIWLEEGEQMSVADMLKAVTVVSANDCAVALAEHICGSEEAFVARMNERAKELGCVDTTFKNCTGLFDDTEHVTSAWDIALISRELISHDIIKEYTTIWMDTLRGGETGLTNTNKLVRFFDGATGLKTGFTQMAGHCLSATACRDDVEYIAVVMNGASSDERFESARTLLNYAFANYTLASLRPPEALPPVMVKMGTADSVQPTFDGQAAKLIEKTKQSELEYKVELGDEITAPVEKGASLGKLTILSDGKVFDEVDIIASDSVERLSRWGIFLSLLDRFTGG